MVQKKRDAIGLLSGTWDDVDTADTTIVEVEILDTARFKTLVAFEEEYTSVGNRSSTTEKTGDA